MCKLKKSLLIAYRGYTYLEIRENNSCQFGIELDYSYTYTFPAHMQLIAFKKRHKTIDVAPQNGHEKLGLIIFELKLFHYFYQVKFLSQ